MKEKSNTFRKGQSFQRETCRNVIVSPPQRISPPFPLDRGARFSPQGILLRIPPFAPPFTFALLRKTNPILRRRYHRSPVLVAEPFSSRPIFPSFEQRFFPVPPFGPCRLAPPPLSCELASSSRGLSVRRSFLSFPPRMPFSAHPPPPSFTISFRSHQSGPSFPAALMAPIAKAASLFPRQDFVKKVPPLPFFFFPPHRLIHLALPSLSSLYVKIDGVLREHPSFFLGVFFLSFVFRRG